MLRIYNTLSRRKEEFRPLAPKQVKIYVCGITPYDSCHLGHARCYVFFDVVRRYLEYKGYKVVYIQNITDIDDKIINRAKEMGEDPSSIASRYTTEYLMYMDLLNIKRASFYPKVTEHIEKIIKVISELINKNYAYRIDGDVYFDVERFSDYGKLSGRGKEARIAGARVEVDPRKRNPADFAIWKEAKEGEPSWESPWGRGRPGWHIECSVISMEYLGDSFDIHGGGVDLIFPHHENEIALSESYTGEKFARYWIHNGFVTINQEKMSKSLGNVFLLKELLDMYSPEIVRFFLLRTHYRSPIDFTLEKLEQAKVGLERFYNVFDNINWELREERMEGSSEEFPPEIAQIYRRFEEAMDDDFNTALALASLYELVPWVNNIISKKDKNFEDKELLRATKGAFYELGSVLGLFGQIKIALKEQGEQEEINRLIKEREEARACKDWTRSDIIRNELKKRGVILEDTPRGTKWRLQR
ncbi:MAG: cysteine--tRNA ligase [bacterium]|nr:cysteine--tRNA ligase [bacterium]